MSQANEHDLPDISDIVTCADDGTEIVSVFGASKLLNIPYNTVKSWEKNNLLGPQYISKGYRWPRYSWAAIQDVAEWRKKSA